MSFNIVRVQRELEESAQRVFADAHGQLDRTAVNLAVFVTLFDCQSRYVFNRLEVQFLDAKAYRLMYNLVADFNVCSLFSKPLVLFDFLARDAFNQLILMPFNLVKHMLYLFFVSVSGSEATRFGHLSEHLVHLEAPCGWFIHLCLEIFGAQTALTVKRA